MNREVSESVDEPIDDGIPINRRPEITARSITQVFMSPEVEAMIEDGLVEYLIGTKTACGIVISVQKPDLYGS